uniref:Uncharacterized protein n=1 Tax=Romanomermis culicivorax TaxID=13658 RepID=A0A915K5D3_ROMCU
MTSPSMANRLTRQSKTGAKNIIWDADMYGIPVHSGYRYVREQKPKVKKWHRAVPPCGEV